MPNKVNSTPGEVETIHPKRGIWRTYDATNGLPGGVECLLQDRQGYLWLGMAGAGLCRYDGTEFITYTTEDGLANNHVESIYQDRKGRLWLGTFGGVSMFDGGEFITYTTDDGLANNSVLAIYEDAEGRLWFGTWGGVSRFDGLEFITYTTDDGLAGNRVQAICADRDGNLWFGVWGGISRFDGQCFTNYTEQEVGVWMNVHSICEDRSGRLWFGSDGLASMFNGEEFVNYTAKDGLASGETVYKIYEDRSGGLWFATRGGGVSTLNGGQFTTYTTADGLLDMVVGDIIQDREGCFWFAHFNSGLTCFDTETLQQWSWVNSGAMECSKNRLWFANNNVLCELHFNGSQSEKGSLPTSQMRQQTFNHPIYSLLEDSRGRFWVGTQGDGLYCYASPDAVWERREEGMPNCDHFTTENGLSNNSAIALLETTDGTIWVGTFGSLCRFNPNRHADEKAFEAIKTRHGIISCLIEDRLGRLWMGGHGGGGLSCYDGKQWVNYTEEHGLLNPAVRSIVEDDAGNVWAGTRKGLHCFDGKQFASYAEAQGILGIHHSCAARDELGYLWFGTFDGGLYHTDGNHFQWLTQADGLPSNTIGALLPQRDGEMVIATSHGVVRYRPTATQPPRAEIREVVADGVYKHPTALELTSTGADLLTISYHGLSLATQKMRYSYILEGYDKKWQDTWENHVRYENLPIGEYTFKVIAINRDLVPSEAPATLKLTIVPDPRNHQIAQLESDLEKRNQELSQANAELTRLSQFKSELLSVVSHELRTPLTSIDGFTRLIHERFLTEDFIAQCNDAMRPTIQRVKDRVQIIRENTSRLARLINDLLDFSRIERGRELEMRFARVELSDVIETVMATYQAPAAEKGLTLHYGGEIPLHSGELEVLGDPDRLTQVLSNLVGNAVKFTPEGGVITLGARKVVEQPTPPLEKGAGGIFQLPYIELTVQDTGVGIPQEQLATLFEPFEQAGTTETKKGGTGLGLAIVKSIVERHEGTVRVESEVGVGSTFIVALPEYVAEVPARTIPQRILIVDDDYDILRLLEEGLSAYPNTRIITACNSRDAFTILEAQPCDVLITDVRMPGDISGIELARQVQEKYPALKVFVMTNTPEEKARVVQLHSDWIDKATPNLIHYIAKKIGRE